MKDTQKVIYLGRAVPRQHFRAYVYNVDGEKKLAESYDDFEKLVSSGLWFPEPVEQKPQKKRAKNAKKDE